MILRTSALSKLSGRNALRRSGGDGSEALRFPAPTAFSSHLDWTNITLLLTINRDTKGVQHRSDGIRYGITATPGKQQAHWLPGILSFLDNDE